MNPLLLRIFLRATTALLVCASGRAQEVRAPEHSDPDRIDAYLAAQVREKGRVGLSVALVKNGQVLLAKGYGNRSLQERLPVEPDTLFAIGSVTKQFTCACVLLLAQEGKLSVHDKVSKYFPKLTRAADVTPAHAENHLRRRADTPVCRWTTGFRARHGLVLQQYRIYHPGPDRGKGESAFVRSVSSPLSFLCVRFV